MSDDRQRQYDAGRLRDHGCQRRPRRPHIKTGDKQQIENDIRNAGNRHRQQWCSCITQSPENTAQRIVGRNEQNPTGTDQDILIRKRNRFGRRLHQRHQRRRRSDHDTG